jgi:hypothetical protein
MSIKVKIDPTDGYIQIRNPKGDLLYDSGSINTSNAASNGDNLIKMLRFGPQSSGAFHEVDDLFIMNSTGATFNDYTVDIGMRGYGVVGDGATTQFTQTGGGSGHFTAVDEADPNGDTDYVQSGTSGHRELFVIDGSLPTSVTDVVAVGGVITWKATDGGGIAGGLSVRSGGTTTDHGTDIALDAAYVTTRIPMEVNPVTGLAFTPAELRGPIQIGVRVA